MLYLTTRDAHDTYTAARTLAQNTAPNGGLYFPFQMPVITCDEIQAISFGENVAQMLNRFFSTRLTGRDVEFAVGRYPLKFASIGKREILAQLWRNLDGSYEKMERRLADRIGAPEGELTSWVRIAIRIAVLTGVFSQLLRTGAVSEQQPLDVALPLGDFSLNMALWYSRQMGLPIQKIICCCEQGSAVWDLLYLGQLRAHCTDTSALELERLVSAVLGASRAASYADALQQGKEYNLLPADTANLRKGMFAAVVSEDRLENTVANVYSTTGCLLDVECAGAYSALMDYRAKTGENRMALLLSDREPDMKK